MSEQLVLRLGHDPAFSEADFFVSKCNEMAYRLLASWPEWPAPAIVLHGPPGSGKTHLAQIWRARAKARLLAADGLAGADFACEEANAVIEDADRAVFPEEALFHLLNLAREQQFFVLMTGRKAPGHWPVTLPDLRSRIRSYPAAPISEPDDELLAAVAVKLFTDRQMVLDPEAIPFLVRRVERSLGAVERLVDAIDTASLSARRKVTKAFVAHILKAAGESEPDEAVCESGPDDPP
jgi:chromosomal replication initiation ATPase DnaA